MQKDAPEGVFRTIDAAARALAVKDFTVDFQKKVGFEAYVAEYKTLYIFTDKRDLMLQLHIGHEVFHHFQNINGLLLKSGSKEEEEYMELVNFLTNPATKLHHKWKLFRWDHERRAEAFGWVFADRYANFFYKNNVFSNAEHTVALADNAEQARLKNALPEDAQEVAGLQIEINRLHERYTSKYSFSIDKALEFVFLKKPPYSFEFIQ